MRSNANLNGQDVLHWYKSIGISFTESGFPILSPLGDIEKQIKAMQFSFINVAKDKDVYVHFYMHDFLFERIWNMPDRYIKVLKQYKGIFMPDFSVFTDMPMPLQQFNYYRSLWYGAYAQKNGIRVIPNAIWGDKETYKWCFEGMPVNDIVSISSVGCLREKENARVFYNGLEHCINTLKPKIILLRASNGAYREVETFISSKTNSEIRKVEYTI